MEKEYAREAESRRAARPSPERGRQQHDAGPKPQWLDEADLDLRIAFVERALADGKMDSLPKLSRKMDGKLSRKMDGKMDGKLSRKMSGKLSRKMSINQHVNTTRLHSRSGAVMLPRLRAVMLPRTPKSKAKREPFAS